MSIADDFDGALEGGGDALFPVHLTGSVQTSGTWCYDWTEQTFDASTGAYSDAVSPRTGTKTAGPFMVELNNLSVATPAYAWARLRGTVGGQPYYEFDAGQQTGGVTVTDGTNSASGTTITVAPGPGGSDVATVSSGPTITFTQNTNTTNGWVGFGAHCYAADFNVSTAALPTGWSSAAVKLAVDFASNQWWGVFAAGTTRGCGVVCEPDVSGAPRVGFLGDASGGPKLSVQNGGAWSDGQTTSFSVNLTTGSTATLTFTAGLLTGYSTSGGGGGGGGGITVIGQGTATTGASTASSLTISALSVASTDLLIVEVACHGSTISGVALGSTNLTLLASVQPNASTTLYLYTMTGGGTGNLVATAAGAATIEMLARSVHNLTSNAVDVYTTASGSGTSASVGSITTSVANEFLDGVFLLVNQPPMSSGTWGGSFSAVDQSVTAQPASLEYILENSGNILSATGSQSGSLSSLTTGTQWAAIIASFK